MSLMLSYFIFVPVKDRQKKDELIKKFLTLFLLSIFMFVAFLPVLSRYNTFVAG